WFGLEQEKAQTFTVELPVLRRGMKTNAVRGLQAQLVGYGYKIDVDGSYGPATENAVECYQEDNGLTPDGIAGPKTRKRMEGI
ncbi:MAG: peptidoglycan-binding protein, partial [Oscillospiraceae bacterium]|nr:peptidoglycan-binding protein [Oscillospiraceae bacterium]